MADSWDMMTLRISNSLRIGSRYDLVLGADRFDQVVKLAEETLPLGDIASGPSEELGFGPEWINHGKLTSVLEGLDRFPGQGWSLIQIGLRNPVVRSRYQALIALSSWGSRENWPVTAQSLLERAFAEEPNEDVRQAIQMILNGESLEDDS